MLLCLHKKQHVLNDYLGYRLQICFIAKMVAKVIVIKWSAYPFIPDVLQLRQILQIKSPLTGFTGPLSNNG